MVIAPLVLLQSTAVVCSYGKMIVKVVVCGEDYGLELRGNMLENLTVKIETGNLKSGF